MKLFAGRSSKKIATAVATTLKLKVAPSETVVFKNSELRVAVLSSVQDEICVVVQSTNAPVSDNLFELALFTDSLKSNGAKSITVVLPYFGYSRQSKAHESGEAISARVAARLIESCGSTAIVTIDIHDAGTQKYFDIPFKNLSAIPLLATSFKNRLTPEKVVILSPDQGGTHRGYEFGKVFFGHSNFEIATIDKSRGKRSHSAIITGFTGNLTEKDVIVVDDIVTSGSTLLPAVELCIKQKAASISAAIVHADFLPEVADKLQKSALKQIIITDTIDFDARPYSKFTKVSVAPLIASSLE